MNVAQARKAGFVVRKPWKRERPYLVAAVHGREALIVQGGRRIRLS